VTGEVIEGMIGMQIKENWTDLVGDVEAVRPSRRKGFVEIHLAVVDARGVEGFENFLGDREGSTVVVLVRTAVLGGPLPQQGNRIRVRVRRGRTPEPVYAHTKHFTIES